MYDKKCFLKPSMEAHTYNLSTWEAESTSSPVGGQPGLRNETISTADAQAQKLDTFSPKQRQLLHFHQDCARVQALWCLCIHLVLTISLILAIVVEVTCRITRMVSYIWHAVLQHPLWRASSWGLSGPGCPLGRVVRMVSTVHSVIPRLGSGLHGVKTVS